jgi:hypothetical protein
MYERKCSKFQFYSHNFLFSIFQYRDRSHRQRERERHRYFRENNARNNINYNRPPRYEDQGGNNYQQQAAAEQDSDSSDSDESEEEESVEPTNDFNRGDDVSENEMADVVEPSDENNGHGFVLEKIAIVNESLDEGAGPSRLIEIFPIPNEDSNKNLNHSKDIFIHSAEIDDSSRESLDLDEDRQFGNSLNIKEHDKLLTFDGNEGVNVKFLKDNDKTMMYPKFYTGEPRLVENVKMLIKSMHKDEQDEKLTTEAVKNVALNDNSDESVDFMEDNNRVEPIPAVNEVSEIRSGH